MLRLVKIIVSFLKENYIKTVSNGDKNLKALLDWKSKKEK
jgi:hypothetical protein